jgi:hypothetical protein
MPETLSASDDEIYQALVQCDMPMRGGVIRLKIEDVRALITRIYNIRITKMKGGAA